MDFRRLPASLAAVVFFSFFVAVSLQANAGDDDPVAAAWPEQFHALLLMNFTGNLSTIDLWYDWKNGRNFNIIREQLSSSALYDLEWNNGTSFFYRLDPGSDDCTSFQVDVGILRPNWLDGANYIGKRHVNGFLCNLWEKADFIWYYEDVYTKRPVKWVFYTGREAHVMTFEVGAALEDARWQVPSYCFDEKEAVDGESRKLPITGRTRGSPSEAGLRGLLDT